MRKITALSLAALGFYPCCSAQQFGIGMSLKQYESTLYLPVKTKGGLLIEGALTYSHSSQSSSQTDSLGNAYNNTYSSSSLIPGVGIFWLMPMTENTHAYLGPRLWYISQKQSNSGYYGGPSGVSTENKTHGYAAAPILGFEYFPLKNISIGGEVGYSFTKQSGSSTSIPVGSSTSDYTSNGTTSSVMVRYYF